MEDKMKMDIYLSLTSYNIYIMMYLKIILLQQQLSIHKIVKKKKCSINIFVTPFSLKKMNKRRKK